MNPWALKKFFKIYFQLEISFTLPDYSYNVAAGLIWTQDLKMYFGIFYVLRIVLPPPTSKWITCWIKVIWIYVLQWLFFCISKLSENLHEHLSRTEVDKQKNKAQLWRFNTKPEKFHYEEA